MNFRDNQRPRDESLARCNSLARFVVSTHGDNAQPASTHTSIVSRSAITTSPVTGFQRFVTRVRIESAVRPFRVPTTVICS